MVDFAAAEVAVTIEVVAARLTESAVTSRRVTLVISEGAQQMTKDVDLSRISIFETAPLRGSKG